MSERQHGYARIGGGLIPDRDFGETALPIGGLGGILYVEGGEPTADKETGPDRAEYGRTHATRRNNPFACGGDGHRKTRGHRERPETRWRSLPDDRDRARARPVRRYF